MDDEDGIEVLNNALLRGEGSSRTARANRQTPAPKQSRTQATHLPQEMPPPFGQQNPQQGPQLDANTLMVVGQLMQQCGFQPAPTTATEEVPFMVECFNEANLTAEKADIKSSGQLNDPAIALNAPNLFVFVAQEVRSNSWNVNDWIQSNALASITLNGLFAYVYHETQHAFNDPNC